MLDQAPPISVVFLFFFGGTLFGILGGVLLGVYQNDAFYPSSKAALTFTHILALGVMLSFMLAALFQMLPVIAGVKLTSPVKKANWLQYPLVIEIISLLFAFNLKDTYWLYLLTSILLGSSLLFITFIMIQKLIQLQNHSAASKGMILTIRLKSLFFKKTCHGYILHKKD